MLDCHTWFSHEVSQEHLPSPTDTLTATIQMVMETLVGHYYSIDFLKNPADFVIFITASGLGSQLLIVSEICLFHPSFQVQAEKWLNSVEMVFCFLFWLFFFKACRFFQNSTAERGRAWRGSGWEAARWCPYCPLLLAGRLASLSMVCLWAHSHISAPHTPEDRELKGFALWTVVPLGILHILQPEVSFGQRDFSLKL